MAMSQIPGLAVCLNSSYFGFFAHAGFLAGLLERGCRPQQISGASAGALVAGLFAGGMQTGQIIDLLTSIDLGKIYHEWTVPVRATKMMFNRRGVTGAILSNRAAATLREHLGDRRIEECNDPSLAIAVTNLSGSKAEIATSGPLADFIAASCAYPGVFSAHPVEGQLYWDGGIANPAPIEHWIDDPTVKTILVHFVAGKDEMAVRDDHRELNIFDSIGLSHQIISDEIFRLQAKIAERAGKRLIFLRTITPRPGLTKMHLGPQLIEMGRATADTHAELFASLRS